jgi:hypothetical protein
MSQFPYSSGPRSFGGSSYHSMSPLQSSSFTGYSTTQLHHDATRTIWSAKSPNIGNLTARKPTIPSVSQANTPEVFIAEPETRPLSANVSTLPRFETMKSEIKSYITDRKELSSLKYALSWEEFLAFREEAKESVPGWQKLKYVITFFISLY